MSTDQFASALVDAIEHKNWQLAAACAIIVVVSFIKWLAPKIHGKAGAFLNSDRGGTLLALFSGIAGAIGSALIAGHAITINLLVSGVATGVTASGGWNVIKKLWWPKDVPPASPVAASPTTTAVATKALVLLPLLFMLSGCNATSAQWKTAGIDTGLCVAPAVIDAAGDALVAALSAAQAGTTVDYKQEGIALATQYGPTAAICAVGKLWKDLGGPLLAAKKMQPTSTLLMVDWLVNHQDQWAVKQLPLPSPAVSK